MIYKYLKEIKVKEIKVKGKTQPVFYLIFHNSIFKELNKDCILYEDRHIIIRFISAKIDMDKYNFNYNLPEIYVERKEIPFKLMFNLYPNVTALSEDIVFCCTKYNKKINKYLNKLRMFTELSK